MKFTEPLCIQATLGCNLSSGACHTYINTNQHNNTNTNTYTNTQEIWTKNEQIQIHTKIQIQCISFVCHPSTLSSLCWDHCVIRTRSGCHLATISRCTEYKYIYMCKIHLQIHKTNIYKDLYKYTRHQYDQCYQQVSRCTYRSVPLLWP